MFIRPLSSSREMPRLLFNISSLTLAISVDSTCGTKGIPSLSYAETTAWIAVGSFPSWNECSI